MPADRECAIFVVFPLRSAAGNRVSLQTECFLEMQGEPHRITVWAVLGNALVTLF